MSQAHPAHKLMLPLVPAYRLALALRELRLRSGIERAHRLRFPVISVGSLSAGGAGKTPLTIALAKLLTREGFHVDVLSRGYGRQNPQPARVRMDGTAEDFGDEPLLIAREAGVPVYVADRRYQAGLLAEKDAAPQNQPTAPTRLHLLDDGFQHRQLARDADIVLINSNDWHDGLLPAGNLREPLSAIRRASVVAVPADEPDLEFALKAWGWNGPIWRLRRKIEVAPTTGPVAAFCGIARPEQFFRGIESAGLRLAVRTTFPDHHRYSAREINRLLSTARAAGAAALITTEKDEVRLGKFLSKIASSFPLLTARLRIEFERESEVVEWLKTRLS
jgi:tetraacyldisaccharide 4'-kinase